MMAGIQCKGVLCDMFKVLTQDTEYTQTKGSRYGISNYIPSVATASER